jgi:hypothetical protein
MLKNDKYFYPPNTNDFTTSFISKNKTLSLLGKFSFIFIIAFMIPFPKHNIQLP